MPEWTPEQKAEALELYVEHGPAEAGQMTGIPSGTIRSWAHRAGMTRLRYEKTEAATTAAQARAEQKRSELRELILDQALELLHRMNAPHSDFRGKDAQKVTWDTATSGDTRNYAIAVGTLIDKYRLEMGEVTARTYHEGTDDIDRRVKQLMDEMDRRGEAEASRSPVGETQKT